APLSRPLNICHTDSLRLFRGFGPEAEASDWGPFDFCIGNPPYVGEIGHQALFRKTLADNPAWRPFYQGRMDYLYFFFLLGVSRLKEGGRLGFITTRYWLTADGAKKLRTQLLEQCRILEIIDFSHHTLFE